MTNNTQLSLQFPGFSNKKVIADFSGGSVSSDSGLLLFSVLEKKCGFIKKLTGCLFDSRHQSYIDHTHREMLSQRIYQIAAGYEDCNDSTELRKDPVIKTICKRLPLSGEDLASQPTLSRLENVVSRTMLYRMGLAFVNNFISSYSKAPKSITLDLDDTCDPTHGAQQLTLFNKYYDTHCYQPLHIYEGNSGDLITTILRPGKRTSGKEVVSVLKRLVKQLRSAWPNVKIMVRGDSHFGVKKVMDYCDSASLSYVLGFTGRKNVIAAMDMNMDTLQEAYDILQQKIRYFEELDFQAPNWKEPRRVIVKMEVSEQGQNTRCIVTSLKGKPKYVYDKKYCTRGQMENFIKDHKNHLHSDRTSCNSFMANQFRLFLHSAAYVFLHTLRKIGLKGTEYAKAQFDTIRNKILKIGARVIEKASRIKFCLPGSYPYKYLFAEIHRNLALGFL